jgi:hypothetical protein
MRRSRRASSHDRLEFLLTLGGHLRRLFDDFVSSPLPRRLTELVLPASASAMMRLAMISLARSPRSASRRATREAALYFDREWPIESLGALYKKDRQEFGDKFVYLHDGTLDYALRQSGKLLSWSPRRRPVIGYIRIWPFSICATMES